MEKKNNPWKVATIILAIIALTFIIVDIFPSKNNSNNDLNNLIEISSNHGMQKIQLCDMELGKCLPLLEFKKVEGTGVCKTPNPTCELFKKLKLVK